MNRPGSWSAGIAVCSVAIAFGTPLCTADAATATATMAVSATVLSFCSIAATPLVFGNYSAAQISSNASIIVTCTTGTTYNIGLDAGVGLGATVNARKMTSGSNELTYSVYTNAGATNVWGSTIGTNTVSSTGTGATQTLTVYGQVPANQYVAPGVYADVITATISY